MSSSDSSQGWGSRVGLILAMAGNAVGLGNFLRFPMQAVENGGGAFIIPYLICFLLMGIPLLWIEWTMGRFGGMYGNHSTPFILDNMTHKRFWKYFGVFGIFTNICVAAYYCYIESWTLIYVFKSLGLEFSGLNEAQTSEVFTDYVSQGFGISGLFSLPVLVYVACLSLNIYFLSRGLKGGVEKVAKAAMPLLLIFGALLAIRGLTMGAPEGATRPDANADIALNFLWSPNLTSLADPKVWFAAAGQIFFTLSAGMGTIHCYASYVKSKDDIALNAMSAGWMNGFVEIVLGASVVVPIAAGYLGFDWVRENAGFSMAFETMPFLFFEAGDIMGALSGFIWFGLLFIAGITSSLAMGTPWMGFMKDEFNWGANKSAISFGLVLLAMGLPTIMFYDQGVFGEYDFWTGTAALVIFATAESILFAWIFGINRGWAELQKGADLKVPGIFKYIMLTVTPVMLIVLFTTAVFKPAGGNWGMIMDGKWEFADNSIVGMIGNKGIKANRDYKSNVYESDVAGTVATVAPMEEGGTVLEIEGIKQYYRSEFGNPLRVNSLQDLEPARKATVYDTTVIIQTYTFPEEHEVTVSEGETVTIGDPVAKGEHYNKIFYLDMARLYLLALFVSICIIVYRATMLRFKTGRIDELDPNG